MKKFTILLVTLILAFQSFGQDPDPELFKTWQLYSIIPDFGHPAIISEIDPPIRPYLTVNYNLSFEGFGACNSFSGNFILMGNSEELRPINYTQTTETCEHQIWNDFEFYYFDFFSTEDDYWYNIFIDSSDGLQHMHYTNNPFGLVLDFIAGEPLSIQGYNSEKFKLYPNPATDRLFIKSEDAQIIKTIVYSISGKRILEGEPIEGALDITSLAKGMYFLELTTSEGHRSVVKFIKK
ncbi:T9SS type A sorting domain-containing protein [Aequorivita marisscotiae]|uniref:T9SS type A sorting domain-containing protein n=1 Tax=Aequorivita marisscotiae TaxID=3040348 RepID=A0ABY8KXL2_9FLAO|nr:T9SS type A sorting domain-containing protein [Aequorivita sp. Ant34-E75]WGF93713.1 T9SS type A sorting domain-containing protein [Aequorivita sp. Ant34-E75]